MDIRHLAQIGVLGKLWPAERVVLGIQVCKWMSAELTTHVDDVAISGYLCQDVESFEAARGIAKFSKNAVSLLLRPTLETQFAIVQALEGAMASGFGPALVRLDLAVKGYVYDYKTGSPCGIGAVGVAHLANGLRVCQKLQYLSLRSNKIAAAGVRHLSKVFSNARPQASERSPSGALPALTHLDLSDNSLETSGATILAEWIGSCHTLRHLNLQLNKIGPDGAEALAPALANCSALSALDMRKNWIADSGAAAILRATDSRLKTIHFAETKASAEMFSALRGETLPISSLDLSGCTRLSPALVDVSSVLRRCPLLSVLRLDDCLLGGADARGFARAVGACRELTDLSLARNRLTSEWAEALGAGALAECRKLLHLDVSHNGLGRGLQQHVVAGSWPRLTYLNVSNVGLDAEGLRAVAAVVGACLELVEVDVSDIRVCRGEEEARAEAVGAMACAIRHLSRLRVLTMQRTGLGGRGVEAIVSAVEASLSLCEVVLWDNGVDREIAAQMRERVRDASPRLTRFCVS